MFFIFLYIHYWLLLISFYGDIGLRQSFGRDSEMNVSCLHIGLDDSDRLSSECFGSQGQKLLMSSALRFQEAMTEPFPPDLISWEGHSQGITLPSFVENFQFYV